MTTKNDNGSSYYDLFRFYAFLLLRLAAGFFVVLIISILALRWINPGFTAFMLLEDWETVNAEQYNLREWWVPDEEIPGHLKWAVIASEDQLFREHFGFDTASIAEAWNDRLDGRRYRGASTITQQVAKNLYLSPAQSYLRKGIEAFITLIIELAWPKERILEVYLNIAEFGPGIFGLGKAAQTFWGISASEIKPEMSARLATVLPSPKRMRAEPPSPFVQKRSQWVLRQMTQLSGITYVSEKKQGNTLHKIDPFRLKIKPDFQKQTFIRQDTTSHPSGVSIENLRKRLKINTETPLQ